MKGLIALRSFLDYPTPYIYIFIVVIGEISRENVSIKLVVMVMVMGMVVVITVSDGCENGSVDGIGNGDGIGWPRCDAITCCCHSDSRSAWVVLALLAVVLIVSSSLHQSYPVIPVSTLQEAKYK